MYGLVNTDESSCPIQLKLIALRRAIMESDARAFINNHDILICSVWFLFYLIKLRQTRHIVVGGW